MDGTHPDTGTGNNKEADGKSVSVQTGKACAEQKEETHNEKMLLGSQVL